jgi:uncharacterized membrane protein YidH (DUF202 family)
MPDDPDRRTSLAGERTLLAWWRTGFTAIAVALAVGRVLPELVDHATRWPYSVVGIAFAVYGIVLIGFGTRRIDALNRQLGVPAADRDAVRAMSALALVGALLGVAVIVLIVIV